MSPCDIVNSTLSKSALVRPPESAITFRATSCAPADLASKNAYRGGNTLTLWAATEQVGGYRAPVFEAAATVIEPIEQAESLAAATGATIPHWPRLLSPFD
jgi:antirestriction protein ArdC